MAKTPCKIYVQTCWNSWCELDIVRGIYEFSLSRPHWVIRRIGEQLFDSRQREWTPAAAIVSVLPEGFDKRKWGLEGPLVSLVSSPAADVNIERDNEAIGRVSAKYLIEQGFRRLAFVPAEGLPFSNGRLHGFLATARDHGVPAAVAPGDAGDVSEWEPSSSLIEWLCKLDKPCGIGCASDWLARAMIDACHLRGVHVPEEAAIVGADNDELYCLFTDPPISSVAIPWRRVGFEAARWVDRLLAGHAPPRGKTVLIPPEGVVVRRSSDILVVSDPALRQAVAFIREHACEGIAVKEVAAAVRVDRRALERSFRKHLDRSPHDEIRRVQIETAKRLLAGTDMPPGQVCRLAGLSQDYFGANFRQATGQTPVAFRTVHRRR